MATLNERLRDRNIRHQLYLERIKNGEVKRMASFLANDVEPDLIRLAETRTRAAKRLGIAGPQGVAYTRKLSADLGGLLNESLIDKGLPAFTSRMDALSRTEATWAMGVVSAEASAATSGNLLVRMHRPSVQRLRSVVRTQPFEGAVTKEWFHALKGRYQTGITSAVRIGMFNGENIDTIRKRVSQTMKAVPRHQAEAMARTGAQHVATHSREAAYEANEDLISGIQWVATLDSTTCPICGNLDGQVMMLDGGRRPPAHWNCRCTTAPILKNAALQAKLDQVRQRVTRDEFNVQGEVPATTTYNEWLKNQSAKVKKQALGKSRAELFDRGDLDVGDFVNDTDKIYTLRKLLTLEPDAFEAAGMAASRFPKEPILAHTNYDGVRRAMMRAEIDGDADSLRAIAFETDAGGTLTGRSWNQSGNRMDFNMKEVYPGTPKVPGEQGREVLAGPSNRDMRLAAQEGRLLVETRVKGRYDVPGDVMHWGAGKALVKPPPRFQTKAAAAEWMEQDSGFVSELTGDGSWTKMQLDELQSIADRGYEEITKRGRAPLEIRFTAAGRGPGIFAARARSNGLRIEFNSDASMTEAARKAYVFHGGEQVREKLSHWERGVASAEKAVERAKEMENSIALARNEEVLINRRIAVAGYKRKVDFGLPGGYAATFETAGHTFSHEFGHALQSRTGLLHLYRNGLVDDHAPRTFGQTRDPHQVGYTKTLGENAAVVSERDRRSLGTRDTAWASSTVSEYAGTDWAELIAEGYALRLRYGYKTGRTEFDDYIEGLIDDGGW